MTSFVKPATEYAIPADLRQQATALMGELEADGRDVCKLMKIHLWFNLTTDTPDAGALQEDVDTMAEYLKSREGQ